MSEVPLTHPSSADPGALHQRRDPAELPPLLSLLGACKLCGTCDSWGGHFFRSLLPPLDSPQASMTQRYNARYAGRLGEFQFMVLTTCRDRVSATGVEGHTQRKISVRCAPRQGLWINDGTSPNWWGPTDHDADVLAAGDKAFSVYAAVAVVPVEFRPHTGDAQCWWAGDAISKRGAEELEAIIRLACACASDDEDEEALGGGALGGGGRDREGEGGGRDYIQRL